jgi:hypothetical protein
LGLSSGSGRAIGSRLCFLRLTQAGFFYATLLNFAIWLLNSGKYPTF